MKPTFRPIDGALASGTARQRVAYSVTEICQLTGLGRTTVFIEIAAGRLPARKIGRRTIVLAHDLNVYISTRPLRTSGGDERSR